MNFLQKLIGYFFDPSQEDSFWSVKAGQELIQERKIDDQDVVPSMDSSEVVNDDSIDEQTT